MPATPKRKAAKAPVRRTAPKKPTAGKARASSASTRAETALWTPRRIPAVRRDSDIPKACPICGSTRLDVRRTDGVAKGAAKVVVTSIVPVPLVLRVHPEVDCLSCGWRAEATH